MPGTADGTVITDIRGESSTCGMIGGRCKGDGPLGGGAFRSATAATAFCRGRACSNCILFSSSPGVVNRVATISRSRSALSFVLRFFHQKTRYNVQHARIREPHIDPAIIGARALPLSRKREVSQSHRCESMCMLTGRVCYKIDISDMRAGGF